jgi:hypothetical protein
MLPPVLAAISVDHLRDRLVARGSGDGDVHAGLGAGEQQAVGDVVAVAEVGEAEAGEPSLALPDGLQVGKGLAGVGVVGQGVDHRDGAGPGEPLEVLLGEGAQHDGVDVTGQHRRGVLDGLAAAELGLAAGERQRVAAQLVDGDLEGDPGAGRWLLEDQRDGAAGEGRPRPPVGLVPVGAVEQRDQLIAADVVDGEEVTLAHGLLL